LRLDPAQTRSVLFAEPSAEAAQRFIPDVPTPDLLPALLRAKQTLARFAWQFPDNPRLTRYLRRIHVPTLIVWGEQDGFVSPAHGKAYQGGIDGAALHILPQCGHLPHIEQPQACAAAITTYLAQHGL
jgi:pimeloyl-ACP methyl ester carboxylesterase